MFLFRVVQRGQLNSKPSNFVSLLLGLAQRLVSVPCMHLVRSTGRPSLGGGYIFRFREWPSQSGSKDYSGSPDAEGPSGLDAATESSPEGHSTLSSALL